MIAIEMANCRSGGMSLQSGDGSRVRRRARCTIIAIQKSKAAVAGGLARIAEDPLVI
jgi:hypothetical protein